MLELSANAGAISGGRLFRGEYFWKYLERPKALRSPNRVSLNPPGTFTDSRCVSDRKGFVCSPDCWNPSISSCIPERRAVLAGYPTRRWILVRQNTRTRLPALLRHRIPAWRRSIHFGRRDKLGNDGADAGFPSSSRFSIERS